MVNIFIRGAAKVAARIYTKPAVKSAVETVKSRRSKVSTTAAKNIRKSIATRVKKAAAETIKANPTVNNINNFTKAATPGIKKVAVGIGTAHLALYGTGKYYGFKRQANKDKIDENVLAITGRVKNFGVKKEPNLLAEGYKSVYGKIRRIRRGR